MNAAELNWLWIEKENEKEQSRCAANTCIPLIQSGHTFLQIILLIIPERSIAALNQTELWVHSLCLWQSNTAGLCDSQREHHLTPSTPPPPLLNPPVHLSFLVFVSYIVCRHIAATHSDFKSVLSLDSLYLWFQFSMSVTLVFLIQFEQNLLRQWTICSLLFHKTINTGLLTDTQTFF